MIGAELKFLDWKVNVAGRTSDWPWKTVGECLRQSLGWASGVQWWRPGGSSEVCVSKFGHVLYTLLRAG